jgi:hypothetical protein
MKQRLTVTYLLDWPRVVPPRQINLHHCLHHLNPSSNQVSVVIYTNPELRTITRNNHAAPKMSQVVLGGDWFSPLTSETHPSLDYYIAVRRVDFHQVLPSIVLLGSYDARF